MTFKALDEDGTLKVYYKDAEYAIIIDKNKYDLHTFIKCTEPTSLVFVGRHLTKLAKATILSSCIHLFVSADFPIRVEFDIDGNDCLKFDWRSNRMIMTRAFKL